MARIAKELSALAVNRLHDAGLHAVGGVSGLHLQVSASGARSWILRITVAGRRRDIGVGSFPTVTLAGAREKARELRALTANGLDPVLERREAAEKLRAQRAQAITFDTAAQLFLEARSDEWRNAKHRAQWSSTLETYASPVVGRMQVGAIEHHHIMKILEPIWKTKTETASRLRGRVEAVLNWATVRGYRTGLNPARWRGHLDSLLPAPRKIAKVTHHAALAIDQVPDFLAALKLRKGGAARALEFAILTAARSGEVRGAGWDEVDFKAATWTIPASRMKAGKEHRVPLSPHALAVLEAQPKIQGYDLIFAAARGGPLSDMTLTAVMRRMEVTGVPHGFRSTFRDWVSERTAYPREVAEMALAHSIGNAVEAAYRRGDLFAKRATMMDEWGTFCLGGTLPIANAAGPDK